MSEDRRPDGVEPVFLLRDRSNPQLPTEEDIAVEEGEPESLSGAAHLPSNATPSLPPDAPLSQRPDSAHRARGRRMLRIPDDEVARPSEPAPRSPSLGSGAESPVVPSTLAPIPPPAPIPPQAPISPPLAETAETSAPPATPFEMWGGPPVSTSRIITINPTASTDDLGLPPWDEALQPPPQPENTAKELPSAEATPHDAVLAEPLPLSTVPAVGREAEPSSVEPYDLPLTRSSEILVEEDISEPLPASSEPASEPVELSVANPAKPAPHPDTETFDRKSEPRPRPSEPPADLAEVSPEDFVSVESVPAGSRIVVSPAVVSVSVSKPPAAPPPPPPLIPRPLPVPISSPLAPPPMNEAAAARRRARPWWEELFNDDFIRTMPKITDAQIATEVDFIEGSLGLAKNAVVLDLACGTGRHAIEMARRGYQIVGFDLSLAMLARAADEAQERNQKLNFVQGDMREMTFGETFDGVYMWNTSFGFFEEEKNNVVITHVHRALKAGGLLLLDVINRDYLARQAPSLAWFEGDGCVCMDEMYVDWITSRMRIKRTMMLDDGRAKETDYSIRVYSLHELGKILHDQGFRVAEVSGRVSTPGVFFGADSPRILVVAEKR